MVSHSSFVVFFCFLICGYRECVERFCRVKFRVSKGFDKVLRRFWRL